MTAFHLRAALLLMTRDGPLSAVSWIAANEFGNAMSLTADEIFELHAVLSHGFHELNEWRSAQKPK